MHNSGSPRKSRVSVRWLTGCPHFDRVRTWVRHTEPPEREMGACFARLIVKDLNLGAALRPITDRVSRLRSGVDHSGGQDCEGWRCSWRSAIFHTDAAAPTLLRSSGKHSWLSLNFVSTSLLPVWNWKCTALLRISGTMRERDKFLGSCPHDSRDRDPIAVGKRLAQCLFAEFCHPGEGDLHFLVCGGGDGRGRHCRGLRHCWREH